MPTQLDSNANVDSILDFERRILRALCSSSVLAHERETAMNQLAAHTWRAPEHRVVYQALTRMRSRDAAALRAELPSMATRMGFPDVEWNEYFGRVESATEPDLTQLVVRLAVESGEVPRQS